MILLGIETATESTSIALGKYGAPPASITFSGPKNQLEVIGLAVQRLLVDSAVERSAITAVALDVGPGLFTGLRVGVSFAKAFAGAMGVPIVPVASLDILAFSQRTCSRLIVSVIDARRGEVFYALYRRVPGGGVARVGPYLVSSPVKLATELESIAEPALLVGQGAIRYKDVLSKVSQVQLAGSAVAYPLTQALLEIAFPIVFSEQFVSPEQVEVIYVRDADARINFEVRHALGKDR